jgi:outer membrane protein assembly factor BamB
MRAILAVAMVVVLAVAFAAFVGTREDADASDEPWTFASAMSQRRSYMAAAELGEKIYAVGGMVGETGRYLSVAQRFDPQADSWSGLPRLPEPVRAGVGAAVGDKMYVIGGQAEEGDGSQVYALDVDTETWEMRARLPEPRFNMAAVSLDGKIYAMGGYEGGEERADVFVYDPATDSWSTGTPLPAPNHTFGAVVYDGEIWAIGGRRGEEVLTDVWIYNPETERWRPGPELPEPMELVGAATSGDEIHAVWESTYQIYDRGTGEWRSGPRPLVTRHGLKAFAVDGSLYTIGGCTTDLHDSQVVEQRRLS